MKKKKEDNFNIPIVLIVGKFSIERKQNKSGYEDKSFGELAWKEIKAKFDQELKKTLNEQSDNFFNKVVGKFVFKNVGSVDVIKKIFTRYLVDNKYLRTFIPPLPLRFDDSIQFRKRKLFKQALYSCLTQLNVIAIISCSPAEETIDLFNYLHPLEIPVFVTVSSIRNLLTGERSSKVDLPIQNILRLIPNNDLQAQAIIEKVFAIHQQRRENNMLKDGTFTFIVYAPEMNDTYVNDLTLAISEHSLKRSSYIHARVLYNLDEVEINNEVLVSVGYIRTLKSIKMDRINSVTIIQTDGCTKTQATVILDTYKKDVKLYLSRPAAQHHYYAEHVYAAISKIWGIYFFPKTSLKSTEGLTLKERLDPFLNFISKELEEEYRNLYYFVSNENQRGGYHIEKLETKKGRR